MEPEVIRVKVALVLDVELMHNGEHITPEEAIKILNEDEFAIDVAIDSELSYEVISAEIEEVR